MLPLQIRPAGGDFLHPTGDTPPRKKGIFLGYPQKWAERQKKPDAELSPPHRPTPPEASILQVSPQLNDQNSTPGEIGSGEFRAVQRLATGNLLSEPNGR